PSGRSTPCSPPGSSSPSPGTTAITSAPGTNMRTGTGPTDRSPPRPAEHPGQTPGSDVLVCNPDGRICGPEGRGYDPDGRPCGLEDRGCALEAVCTKRMCGRPYAVTRRSAVKPTFSSTRADRGLCSSASATRHLTPSGPRAASTHSSAASVARPRPHQGRPSV